MNRQTLYLIILSALLLISVVVFSFLALIPKGKEYRMLRLESKKEFQRLDAAQQRHDEIYDKLKDMQAQNRHTIAAFETPFNQERFSKLYRNEFQDLYLTEIVTEESNGTFKVYEVNVTSKITSPQSFYSFLEGINKSDWIIGINFPVRFERDEDKIRSSFTMKVHSRKDAQKEVKQ